MLMLSDLNGARPYTGNKPAITVHIDLIAKGPTTYKINIGSKRIRTDRAM